MHLKDLFVGRNPLRSLPVALGMLSYKQLSIQLRPPCNVANVPPEKLGSTREILKHLRGLLQKAEGEATSWLGAKRNVLYLAG